MRVLQLISSSGFYGADNVLIELSKQLRYTFFQPIMGVFKNVQSPHLEVAQEAKQCNFPVEIFPCKGRLDFRTILQIRRFLGKQKIDIIHSHGYKSNLYALAASLGTNLPKVTTCHNWLGDDPKMKFYARLDKFFLNQFDRVIGVSDTVTQDILTHNISPNKVLTIYNGINVDSFTSQKKPDTDAIRKELGINNKCRVIGTVGRLSEEKGHSYLLKAAETVLQEYPKVVFLIVGDGPLRQHLEDRSSQLTEIYASTTCAKGAFIFAGVRKDMPAIYSLMDVFVLPSLTEGLPMVLLEAMASKKPVVATSVGAVPNVIEDGHSGLLVRPGDVNDLSQAIKHLLAHPEKASQLAEHARQKVKEQFSSQKMAQRYVGVYQNVLGVHGIKDSTKHLF
jgi:glycosyltransferase involved in cell wall biosynthesis